MLSFTDSLVGREMRSSTDSVVGREMCDSTDSREVRGYRGTSRRFQAIVVA